MGEGAMRRPRLKGQAQGARSRGTGQSEQAEGLGPDPGPRHHLRPSCSASHSAQTKPPRLGGERWGQARPSRRRIALICPGC